MQTLHVCISIWKYFSARIDIVEAIFLAFIATSETEQSKKDLFV